MADFCLNEDDPRYKALDRIITEETAYIAPITLAEIYRRIQKDISNARAELMLYSVLSGTFLRVYSDYSEDMLRSLVEVRDQGYPYTVGFCVALSNELGCPILTNESTFLELEQKGLCMVRGY